jgi:ketosteroid isomerase-like protein
MTVPATTRPADIARAALEALVKGDVGAVRELFAPDAVVWTPAMEVASRDQLIEEISDQRTAFSIISIDAEPADIGPGAVATEWMVKAGHTGRLEFDDVMVEPTGADLVLRGAMFAEIRDGRVVRLRQYWNEVDLIEQLGLLPA